MLLTGFDAPVEQVMYLDRKLREHGLLQAIARVNRVHAGKDRGYIVDYIGIANHLSQALQIYAGDDEAIQDVMRTMTDINGEIPVLEGRYRRIVQFFGDLGVTEIEGYLRQTIADIAQTYAVLEQAVDALEDVRPRAEFDTLLDFFLQSMNIVLPHPAADDYKIPAKRLGFLARRVARPLPGHGRRQPGQGRRQGAPAHQRAPGQPGHRPEDPAPRPARSRLHGQGAGPRAAPRQGQRDGARHPPALQDQVQPGPGLLRQAEWRSWRR